jgi:2-keto-4-pentenoate hydratase/2-oxohepta-3-ene-1,7-dioic acid hydratase in catechol pathway
MRLLSFQTDTVQRPGALLEDAQVLDLSQGFVAAQEKGQVDPLLDAPGSIVDLIKGGEDTRTTCKAIIEMARAGQLQDAIRQTSEVTLIAPIPRPSKNVFCVGSNYRAHVTEASRAQMKQDKTPKLPVFFTKPPTAVIGPGGTVRLDPQVSEKMDYEVELGVVIGKSGRNIRASDALDHIFGFTIINDVTARDLQRAHGGQFLKGKGLDTTCPMGPHIVTLDELPNFEDLRISLSVNGEMRQDGNTGNMIFSIPRLLESLSEGLTLEPGDILATGTPSGVGYAMDPPNYLKDGDEITCEIEGIGQLTNIIRKEETPAFAA